MASRDKKSVGRKQATTTTGTAHLVAGDDAEAASEKPAEERVVRKTPGRKKEGAAQAATKRALKSKTRTKALLEKVKRSGRVQKKTLLKNGVGGANVIRKRALSLRERITSKAKKKAVADELVVETSPRRKKAVAAAVAAADDVPKTPRKRMKKGKDAECTATRPAIPEAVESSNVVKQEAEDGGGDEDEEKRPLRATKKPRLLEKRAKRESAFSKLARLDGWHSQLVDGLDLNVATRPIVASRCPPLRRHSIEKCPLTTSEDGASKLVRPKRATRTRPASAMRILRNGRTRRLQPFPLFDGLDSEYKMRRRLASDFSSGELAKLSGYESDSSRASSLQESLDAGEVLLKKELLETLENNPPDSAEEKQQLARHFSAAIKRSLSLEADADSERKTRSSMKRTPETDNDGESEYVDILSIVDKAACSTPSTSPHALEAASTMDESPESLAEKSQILKALGLQTLQEAEEARKRQGPKAGDSYTGTLKTVIKLSRPTERDKKKASRNPIKMTLQKKGRSSAGREDGQPDEEDEYKVMKDGSSSWKSHGNHSSDTAGAQRKSHYANRSNPDGSSDHTSDGDSHPLEEVGTAGKLLVIPEKASSFSIHPGRLCKDECTYCFGKFGLFDTPCHIAQLKTVERQDKILANEKHLTRDSCLCDACYRHVDRKANLPPYANNKPMKPSTSSSAKKQCAVVGCTSDAPNWLKRKWIMKMRRVLCPVINLDLSQPGQLSLPICAQHYADVEHLMVCAMCKRRLSRNHIHYLGPEAHDIQGILNKMRIPVQLKEKPVVCKICRFYSTYLLKNGEEFNEDARNFYVDLKKRWLQMRNMEPMEDDAISASFEHVFKPDAHKTDPNAARKRKRLTRNQLSEPPVLEPEVDIIPDERDLMLPASDSRPSSPPDYMLDYRNLMPNVAIECVNDGELPHPVHRNRSLSIRRISKEEAQEKKRLRSDTAVQRLGSNPSISIRQMFPGEEDVPLNGCIEFGNAKERTPEGWEKCTSTIQYDAETKLLWHELQKPYGNQSSFLRHLILLEKYFRNGDLLLSARACPNSANYTDTVQNRLRAYDNISCAAGPVQPLTMLPFNNPRLSFNAPDKAADKSAEKIDKSQTSIIPVAMSTPNPSANSAGISQAPLLKSTPLGVSQANLVVGLTSVSLAKASQSQPTPTPHQSPALPQLVTPGGVLISTPSPSKGKPPPLISLQHANKAAASPANSVTTSAITAPSNPMPLALPAKPQSQKIKFPITKNWRPKLIPIDPSVKPEKKPGLVQVISGGKPYHITLEDYKKMCAIKRTYDLRQKRLQETLRNQSNPNSLLKTTAMMKRLGAMAKSSADADESSTTSDSPAVNAIDQAAPVIAPVNPNAQENKMQLNLPRIPKSLTVIPQTVTISKFNANKNASRPISPNAQQCSKAKS